MPSPFSDPDAFIRQHVAQAVVDRYELDPRATSRSLHRMSATGGIVGIVGLMCALVPVLVVTGLPAWLAIVLSLPFLTNMAIMASQIARPPIHAMNPLYAIQRLLWIGMVGLMVVMLVLLPAGTGIAIRVFGVACLVSWTTGVCAIYVHLCRKPPRRPRRETSPKRAMAGA